MAAENLNPNLNRSRSFKRFGIPTALVVGGVTVGSLFAPLGLASAQEDDGDADPDTGAETESTDESGEETDESTERHGRRGHRARHRLRAETVTEALGLSSDEVREGLEAGNTIAELADQQGISRDELTAALVASITEAVEQAVEEGHLDAEEAEEKLADVEAMVSEFIDKDPSELHRHGDGQHRHRGRFGKFGGASEEIQELLGLSGEDIRAAIGEGRSLADLAEEQGVSVDELTDLLVASATERLDQAVENGRVDADRAAELAEALEEKIEAGVNGEFEGRQGFGRRGHRGHHRGGAEAEPSIEDSSLSA